MKTRKPKSSKSESAITTARIPANMVPVDAFAKDAAHDDLWSAYKGDCVDVVKGIPDHSIDFSIFSPPFESLYTYSNSPHDMGNSKTSKQFFEHFDYLVRDLARVMKRGRIVSMHCMDLPTSKERHGFVGLRDFPGELIRAFERYGFRFHSRVTIWKDPVTAMQRTHALGLLYKTVLENGSMCRQGCADYMVRMRAPGDCLREDRVTHDPKEYPCDPYWQNIASPVWMDIDPSDTLQKESARENDDERHLCPLQLEPIRRDIELYTNPMEIVLSPFGGIGSEGHIAVGGATKAGARLNKPRRAVVIELKDSYYAQAVRNLKAAATTQQLSLMDRMGAVSPASGESTQPSVTFGAGGSVESGS